MQCDLSRFKVIYGDRVLHAIALTDVVFTENKPYDINECVNAPVFIEILVINEDGNIVSVRDETWRFQFIPNLNGGR